MKVTSLPDEMLANVLKYLNYINTNRLRKMNSRVNNVAKAYELGTRLPVKYLSFTDPARLTNSDAGVEWELRLEIDRSILRYIKYHTIPVNKYFAWISLNYKRDENHFNIISNILSKIELNDILNVSVFNVDDELLECFSQQQKAFRNLTFLKLYETQVDCSPTSLRDFIKSAKKLHSLDFTHPKSSMDVIFEAGIFDNRQWDMINLSSKKESHSFPRNRLNDEFLLNIVKRCNRLSLPPENSFTVEGIVKLIKDCIIGDDVKRIIHLVYVKFEKTSLEMVQKQIKSIDETNIKCRFREPFLSEEGVINSFMISRSSNNSEFYFAFQDNNNVD